MHPPSANHGAPSSMHTSKHPATLGCSSMATTTSCPILGRTAFAYDPDDGDSWISFTLPPDCFAGDGGFAFASPSPSRLAFALLLHDGDAAWRHAPPLASSRCNPVVAAVPSGSERRLFLVVSGARFVGGLVDIEDRLPTELYDYDPNGAVEDDRAWRWEQCTPLPVEFGMGSSSSLWLSSALVADGCFLFMCGTYSYTVLTFDLCRHEWMVPRELRPAAGLVAAFMASGAGGGGERGRALGVWDVEPKILAARKIGEMLAELVGCMLSGSLQCMGQDSLPYVLRKERHRVYRACAYEVVEEEGQGKPKGCRWRKLLPLPVVGSSALSRFHKMVAFCSAVHLRHHLPLIC